MNNETIFELAIIGGGPAGCAATVYAARKKIKTLLCTYDFFGQSSVSDDIQNWIGTNHISGNDLSKSLEKHVREYEGDDLFIHTKVYIVSIEKDGGLYIIKDSKNNIFKSKTILICSGSKRRKLEIKGADVFEHKGLTYCATCDGPLFTGTDVCVIGAGNAAFESALQLSKYCKSVTILARSATYKADQVTVEKVLKTTNINIINSVNMLEVVGDKMVKGIIINDGSGEKTLDVEGIFVEIGQIPNTDYINIVDKNAFGNIKVDPRTQVTSDSHIWAAGDCTDGLYHQNNIAVGDAIKAVEDLFIHLHNL